MADAKKEPSLIGSIIEKFEDMFGGAVAGAAGAKLAGGGFWSELAGGAAGAGAGMLGFLNTKTAHTIELFAAASAAGTSMFGNEMAGLAFGAAITYLAVELDKKMFGGKHLAMPFSSDPAPATG